MLIREVGMRSLFVTLTYIIPCGVLISTNPFCMTYVCVLCEIHVVIWICLT